MYDKNNLNSIQFNYEVILTNNKRKKFKISTRVEHQRLLNNDKEIHELLKEEFLLKIENEKEILN